MAACNGVFLTRASCSICFEDLLSNAPKKDERKEEDLAATLANAPSRVSATPCGHVFHTR